MWWYTQSFTFVQVDPETQTVAPVQLMPPHWPYIATPDPVLAVVVGDEAVTDFEEVLVVGFAVVTVLADDFEVVRELGALPVVTLKIA